MGYRKFYLAFSVGLAGLYVFPVQPGLCQTLLQSAPISDSQAEKTGFKRHKFSFNAPSLDFETYVPEDAQISTMPYNTEPIEEKQIGRVLPIGHMAFSQENITFENVIFSYRLRYPPAAFRTCSWQMIHNGFGILHSHAPDELVEAEMLGVRFTEEKKPQTAIMAYCHARGDILIANYFMANLPADEKQAENAVNILRKTVAVFVANMQFSDGRPNQLDPAQITSRALHLDKGDLVLSFPQKLDVVIDNSDKKTLPYEIHFIQKLQSGSMFSHLCLLISRTSAPMTEESLAKQAEMLSNAYVSSQIKPELSSSGIEQTRIASNSIAGYAEQGITARSYRYRIIEKSSPDTPTVFQVTLIQDKDTLYALYYHSLRTENSSASEYFTGSAGDVGYDMMRDSIRNFLLRKK